MPEINKKEKKTKYEWPIDTTLQSRFRGNIEYNEFFDLLEPVILRIKQMADPPLLMNASKKMNKRIVKGRTYEMRPSVNRVAADIGVYFRRSRDAGLGINLALCYASDQMRIRGIADFKTLSREIEVELMDFSEVEFVKKAEVVI